MSVLQNVKETFLGALLLLFSLIFTVILELWQYIVISNPKQLKLNTRLISEKQHKREKQLKAVGITNTFSPQAQNILKLSELELLDKLQNKELTAVKVLEAFTAKSLQVTRQYNCVVEYIPGALQWAEQLDKMEGIKGPLHGLPISIKEQIAVKGTDSTIGFAKFTFQPLDHDAPLVTALKELGAIPFCKTNVPQSVLTYGCGNPIFGETVNCLNSKLSPGGSSGGEACLIGGGGSVLGIGTDVGGSLRIPAHFCGITALKPTRARMSTESLRTPGAVMVPLAGTTGFMAKNVKVLTKAYKALFSTDCLRRADPYVVPIPWNETIFAEERQLKFGYYTSLSYFPCIGDTEGVVLDAKRKLERAGYQVVPFELPNIDYMMELLWDFVMADSGKTLTKFWKAEPLSDSAFSAYWVNRLPRLVREVLATVIEFKFGPLKVPVYHSPLFAKMLRAGRKTRKSAGLWERILERKVVMDQIRDQMVSNNIDVLLTPVFPFPAPYYQIPGKISQAVAYTMIWNMLDFPAGVISFGTESGNKIDQFDHKDDYMLRLAQEGLRESAGMPIGVQFIGLPYQEELVLKAMNILEDLKERKQ